MRYALIQNGVVTNVIEAPEGWQPPQGVRAVPSDTAGIGDTYADGEFTPQPQPAHTAPITWPTDGPPPPITFTDSTPAFKE